MGRDHVSELRPPTGLLFIPRWYRTMKRHGGDTCPSVTLPTLPDSGLRGEGPATDRPSHDTTAPFGGQSAVHTSRRPNERVTGRSLGFPKQTNSDSNYTLTRSLHAYGYLCSLNTTSEPHDQGAPQRQAARTTQETTAAAVVHRTWSFPSKPLLGATWRRRDGTRLWLVSTSRFWRRSRALLSHTAAAAWPISTSPLRYSSICLTLKRRAATRSPKFVARVSNLILSHSFGTLCDLQV
jgi:hypothetical protein